MEIKILQVFYDKNGLPYKDKERTVHYPITSGTFLGASNTTQIRFYYDQLDELNESTFVAVSKLPNGKIGSEILEIEYDSELQENYAVLNLSQFYTQYKGDVYISLQGYQGGVRVEQDEDGIYQIYGTPTIQATGSIKLSIAYAPTFIGSGQTENITLQRVLAELSTKLGIRQETLHVEELPTVGNPNVWYVINDDPNDTTKANIYIWNATTQTYVWVGDNTLYLGDYYTKDEGEQFEENINETLDNYGNRITSVENELEGVAQGSPKGVYATVEDLQSAYPTGTTGIFVISSTGYWYYWNGSAWTQGGLYLSSEDYDNYYNLLKNSQALVEVDTSGKTEGYISTSGDTGSGAPAFSYIDNITLKKGQTIFVKEDIDSTSASAICVIAEYDTNFYLTRQTIVNAVGGDHIYTFTATRDMAVSLTLLTDNSYECYIFPTIATNIDNLLNGKIKDNTLSLEKLYDGDFKEIYEEPLNYFDKNNCYRARLDYNNGKMLGYEKNDYCTYFIDVTGKNHVYIFSAVVSGVQAFCIAFYDSSKTFISATTWTFGEDVPSNAKYCKVSFTNDLVANYNPMVMFINDRPLQYIEPFKRTLRQIQFEENMPKMFKTIGIIGDSLSSGEVYTENGTPKDKYDYSWLANFCKKSGATPTYYSTGGMSTKSWLTSGYRTNFDNDPNLDAYFVALGTNDASQGQYGIGNISDAAGTDSFVGYYKEIIETIHTKAPNAVIFCLSMYGNGNDTYQTPYTAIIKQIAALYSYCFFVDFANNCPQEINLSISRIYTFWQENWHYTGAGYIEVATVIYRLVNKIILDNKNWFKFFVANL